MSEMRSRTVRSNSFRPDYGINGATLVDAIERGFGRIARDALLGQGAGYRLVSVWAEYRNGILGGRGGVELVVEHTGMSAGNRPADPEVRRSVVWIHARPEDLAKRHEFKIRTGETAA